MLLLYGLGWAITVLNILVLAILSILHDFDISLGLIPIMSVSCL